MTKIIFNDKEYETYEELKEEFPNVYMSITKKIKDTTGKVIGREYFYKEYSQEQMDQLESNKLEQKVTRGRIECFEIINRGKLWYDSLTATQITELKAWYQEWLDIPIKPLDYMPVKPDWIK